MIDRNMVNTSGVDLLKGHASNVNTSNYYVPLFKVKLDGVAENDIEIQTEFTVKWFSGGENYSNNYLAKFLISSNIPSISFYKRSLNEGVGINLCFIQSGEYYILYAKGGNQYFDIGVQITYCNYPEEITLCTDDDNIAVSSISSYSPTYPSEKYTIGITPGTNYYQATNDFQQYTEYLKDGTCVLNISFFKNSTLGAGDVICTIDKKPILHKIPVQLFLRKISDASVFEVAYGELNNSNGQLTITNVPTVVTGGTYIIVQLVYDSVNNSI